MDRIHQLDGEREELLLDLDEIARAGAKKMLAQALETEVQDWASPGKTVLPSLKTHRGCGTIGHEGASFG